MKTFVVLCVVLAANPVSAADSDPLVNISGGPVRGTALDKVGAAFKGIPYAQPPLYETLTNEWAGDKSFRCPATEQLAWHAAAGNAGYQYEFARVSPEREVYGVIHAAELAYLFGTLGPRPVTPGLPAQGADAVGPTEWPVKWSRAARADSRTSVHHSPLERIGGLARKSAPPFEQWKDVGNASDRSGNIDI